MNFTKMHGLGNDFIFLDHFSPNSTIDENEYPALAQRLCHRQFGIGGDGLIIVLPSQVADVQMRIINSDGSEPEMCGNGIRCLARYVYDHGYVKKNPLKVETLAGVLTIKLELEGDKVEGIQVDMGEPIFRPELIPVNVSGESVVGATLTVDGAEWTFTAVSMGNPHCIIFVDDMDALDFEHLGPAIEKHPLFPRKTNVEFIQVISRDEIRMKVWERGAGPTLACGTGACASAVASVLNDKADRKVLVHLPGGDLKIEWADDNHVYMTGPAAYVFEGTMK